MLSHMPVALQVLQVQGAQQEVNLLFNMAPKTLSITLSQWLAVLIVV